ncbi:MAG: GAF domain-containing protein [Bdellovibrionota bacterium]
MSNAAKKKPQDTPDPVDAATDREEGLAKNFEDPALEGILLDFAEPGDPAALLNETADAVQELIAESPAEPVEELLVVGPADIPAEAPVEPEFDVLAALAESTPAEAVPAEAVPDFNPPMEVFNPSDADSGPIVAMEETAVDSLEANARWEMAEQLFELVVCDRPFPDMVESILAAVVNGLGAEAGSILEMDAQKSEFFFRASVGGGDPEQLKSFRVPANKGIVGHVAESRQVVLLKDLQSDELQLRAVSAGTGFETRTCIAAPILLTNQVYGVIELFNKKSGESFNERDVELLEETIRMAVKILEVRFLTAELVKRIR